MFSLKSSPTDFKSLASVYSATPANCYKGYFRKGRVSREIISTGSMTGGRRRLYKEKKRTAGWMLKIEDFLP
jgi:hypothetical protein